MFFKIAVLKRFEENSQEVIDDEVFLLAKI